MRNYRFDIHFSDVVFILTLDFRQIYNNNP